MSVAELRLAIRRVLEQSSRGDAGAEAKATALFRPLEAVWPILEELADTLSSLSGLPLIIFLGDFEVHASDSKLLPAWCSLLNSHSELRQLCARDERARAGGETRVFCHSGMMVAQRRISVFGIADVTILFGVRRSADEEAVSIRENFLAKVRQHLPAVYGRLLELESSGQEGVLEFFSEDDFRVMDSIQQTLQALIEATVNFHIRAVNMTHEVTMVLQGTSALLADIVEELQELGRNDLISSEFLESVDIVEAEHECALYVLQNFLSNAGHAQYSASHAKPLEDIDATSIFDRLVQIYSRTERGRKLTFENDLPRPCPRLLGHRLELTRAFHNIMSNAVKYSYVTVGEGGDRRIRIYGQIPYGTSNQRREWAICIENYGVGLRDEEQYRAFQPGFRGKGGIEQTGLGAGIGLSEVQKIMHAHDGRAKIRSRYLHHGRKGDVYLTTVSLVFPFR